MDYNIEPGIGTEQNCDSVGEGSVGVMKRLILNGLTVFLLVTLTLL